MDMRKVFAELEELSRNQESFKSYKKDIKDNLKNAAKMVYDVYKALAKAGVELTALKEANELLHDTFDMVKGGKKTDGDDDTPKKRRGRPAKKTDDDDAPRRRGRPRKAVDDDEEEETPRRRGRPRKVQEDDEEEEAPRRRGRPAKKLPVIEVDDDDDDEEDDEPIPTKSKKAVVEEDDFDFDE